MNCARLLVCSIGLLSLPLACADRRTLPIKQQPIWDGGLRDAAPQTNAAEAWDADAEPLDGTGDASSDVLLVADSRPSEAAEDFPDVDANIGVEDVAESGDGVDVGSADGRDIARTDASRTMDGGFAEVGPALSENADLRALLVGKTIIEMVVRDDQLWILYLEECSFCLLDDSGRSSPVLYYGLVVVVGGGKPKVFAGEKDWWYQGISRDSHGNLYAAVKIPGPPSVTYAIVNLEPLLTDGARLADLQPFCVGSYGFVIDHDDTFWGWNFYEPGLFECTPTSEVVHTRDNSPLPSDSISNVTIDGNGDKWVMLDVPGDGYTTATVRISGKTWEAAPPATSPRLDKAYPGCVDGGGSLWADVDPAIKNPDNLLNVQILDLECDNRGVLWRVVWSYFGSQTAPAVIRTDEIAYMDQDEWHAVAVPDVGEPPHAIAAYHGEIVLGTSAGLQFLKMP
jgi:hypothetical protein